MQKIDFFAVRNFSSFRTVAQYLDSRIWICPKIKAPTEYSLEKPTIEMTEQGLFVRDVKKIWCWHPVSLYNPHLSSHLPLQVRRCHFHAESRGSGTHDWDRPARQCRPPGRRPGWRRDAGGRQRWSAHHGKHSYSDFMPEHPDESIPLRGVRVLRPLVLETDGAATAQKLGAADRAGRRLPRLHAWRDGAKWNNITTAVLRDETSNFRAVLGRMSARRRAVIIPR